MLNFCVIVLKFQIVKGGEKVDRKRQIPKIKEICASKLYNDLVYSYLQTISDEEGKILKFNMNHREIGEKVGLSRQTVATKIKNLEELELLKFIEDTDEYELIILEPNIAALIPEDTLKLLIDTMNEKTISIYVYLFKRFYANKNKPYTVTYTQLKDWIGVSTKTTSNNRVVSNILMVLKKIGLLDYELSESNNKVYCVIKNVKLKIQVVMLKFCVVKCVKNLRCGVKILYCDVKILDNIFNIGGAFPSPMELRSFPLPQVEFCSSLRSLQNSPGRGDSFGGEGVGQKKGELIFELDTVKGEWGKIIWEQQKQKGLKQVLEWVFNRLGNDYLYGIKKFLGQDKEKKQYMGKGRKQGIV